MIIQNEISDDGADSIVTVENFIRIRKFIFAQGQRQTYCNRFSDNPYYEFRDNLSFYLNPEGISTQCDITGFSTIVVATYNQNDGQQYWHVELGRSEKRLRISLNYKEAQHAIELKKCAEFFKIALEEIERVSNK